MAVLQFSKLRLPSENTILTSSELAKNTSTNAVGKLVTISSTVPWNIRP